MSELRITPSRLKKTHIPALDAIANTHLRDTQSPTIALSGHGALPLLYKIASTLLSPPHAKTLVVFDVDGRFDATRLACESHDLQHLYIQRPARSSTPEQLRALVAEAENFMLYEDESRPSRHREWWGTMVLGGLAAGDLTAGWKGWLRVDRTFVSPFALDLSVREAWLERAQRQKAVDEAGWTATSQWGSFDFKE